jgi:hypothetical protein
MHKLTYAQGRVSKHPDVPALTDDLGEPGRRAVDLRDWERGDLNSAEWANTAIEYEHADGPPPGRWIGLAETAEAVRD